MSKINQRKKSNSSFSYSALEDRKLLAVTAFLSEGTAVIRGDGFDNQVIVQQVNETLRVNVIYQGTFDFDFDSVSTLRFVGGNGDDVFTNQTDITTIAAGNDGNDRLTSGNGNDRLFGGAGNDILISSGGTNLLNGFDGNDNFTGGSGNDTIFGLDGDDIVNGGAGNDFVVGGIGNDTINGDDGNDTVFASAGNDTVSGGNGNDFLYGQDGVDDLSGGSGNDLIRGGSGNDTQIGGTGDDRILGEDGIDELRGNDGKDVIFGGDDSDTIFGDGGTDFLYGGLGDDTIRGGVLSDQIRGNEGNDTLFGDAGNDRIAGDDGDDVLDGGIGFDTVLGDAGKDEITGTSTDFVRGGAGDDLISLSSANGDSVGFLANYDNFVVTQLGASLRVRDTVGNEGLDTITGADSLRFTDQVREAAADVSRRVYVQPIIVSNSNGSNTAEYFGTSEQAAEIMRLIDEIYLQANVDIEFLTPTTLNDSFTNVGNSSTRPTSDLNTIVNNGDSVGVGNSDPLVIDAYFVEVAAGFSNQRENVANGLAFVDGNGTTIHVGDSLPTFVKGRGVVSRVVAHEIGHNLGLVHTSDGNNLMGQGSEINSSQRNTILNSQFAGGDSTSGGQSSAEDSQLPPCCGGAGCSMCSGNA